MQRPTKAKEVVRKSERPPTKSRVSWNKDNLSEEKIIEKTSKEVSLLSE